jgi:hypothetical protein
MSVNTNNVTDQLTATTGAMTIVNGGTVTIPTTTGTLALVSGTVTSFQTSLSGLTPSVASNGSVTLGGTLGVASGGTG